MTDKIERQRKRQSDRQSQETESANKRCVRYENTTRGKSACIKMRECCRGMVDGNGRKKEKIPGRNGNRKKEDVKR